MPSASPTLSTKSDGAQRSSSSPVDLVAPRYLSLPSFERTLGGEVAAVATLAGFPPDPEQQLLLDAAFAVDAAGKSAAFEVVVIAPRQNLKTGFMKQYALGQLFVRDERLVVWSAHEFGTAQEALRDVEALIDGSEWLRKRVRLTNRGDVAKHGAVPEIETGTGARLIFKTRTAGGGRGLSGRKTLLDEAYALQPGHVGALYPIMLAQPDPQLVVGSSACRPESTVLWDLVQRGRAGGDPRLAYAEWCTPDPVDVCAHGAECTHGRGVEGCGCDKPEVVRLAHSAIARGRILLETVVDLRKSMPPDEYGREVMGWHDPPDMDSSDIPIDPDAWSALTDPDPSHAPSTGAFAVEVDRDRAWSSIGAAGVRDDGLCHLEVVQRERGTGWVVDRCVELDAAHGPVSFAVDGGGPASSLIEPLQDAGLTVVTAGFRDLAQACGDLVDAVASGSVVHGPQPELEEAVVGARKRNQGDGGFTFGRRVSGSDVTPLLAVTLARWALDAAYDVQSSIF